MLKDRDKTIDIAKGIAIIAIVLGHVLRGLVTAGIADDSPSVQAADQVIYSFHLSVFAFLSGLFVAGAVVRDGMLSYLRSRTATFLYCYVLWTLLQGAVKVLSGRLTGEPESASGALASLWRADTQLWFYGFLIVASVFAVLVRPWEGPSRTWATGAVCLLSLVFWGIGVPAIFGSPAVFFGAPGWGLLGFFILGAGWKYQGVTRVLDRGGKLTPVLALTSIAGFIVLHMTFTIATPTESPNRTIASIAVGVVVSVLGVAAVLLVSRLLTRTPAARLLAFIGLHSLEIFLAHIIAASGTRAVLSKIGVEDFSVHLIAGTIAGVALPLLLWWLCEKANFPWLFKKPTMRQRIAA